MKQFFLSAVSLMLATGAAAAADLTSPPPVQTPPASDWNSFHGFLGVGGGTVPKFEGAKKYQAMPLAVFNVNYGNFTVKSEGLGISLGYTVNDLISFGPIVQYHGQRDAISSLALPKVKGTADVGGFVGIGWKDLLMAHDTLSADIKILGDAGNVYKGYTVAPSLGYGMRILPNVLLNGNLSTTYADKSYIQSYYSAGSFKARAGIKDVGGNLNATYAFTPNWGLTLIGGYKRLVGDAASSPVVKSNVGSPNQFIAGAGIAYRF
jgi:outer membrane scaffolding protein for murein synthesis (MipA/OmpV family)